MPEPLPDRAAQTFTSSFSQTITLSATFTRYFTFPLANLGRFKLPLRSRSMWMVLVKQRRSGFAFLRKPHQMRSIPSRDHDSRIQAGTGRYREEDRNFELVDLFSDQLIKPWTDSSWQKVFTEKTHAAQAYFRHHGK